jgi:CRP/FNR family cyclic AMP-dependent transcriptional regulator
MLAILKSVPLFAGLPEVELNALAGGATVRKVLRGMSILRVGETTEYLYVILAGRVKVLITSAGGREIILAKLGPHEFFGDMELIDDQPPSTSVQTLQPCELLCVAKVDFMRFMSDNCELEMRIIRGLVKRLREANRQIESLALMNVVGRVARVLLDVAENVDGERIVHKMPPKQEIANMIGASREMVSRAIKGLHNSGQIRVDKRRIVLLGTPGGSRASDY